MEETKVLEPWQAEVVRTLAAQAVQMEEAVKQARRRALLTAAHLAGWATDDENAISVTLEPSGEVTVYKKAPHPPVVAEESHD